MSSSRSRQIVGLDALRFLAALLVLAFHFGFWDWAKKADPLTVSQFKFPALQPFVWTGWVGVEIFFVLSGFVIAYSADGSDAWTFARRRLERLFPAALICSSLTFLFVLTDRSCPGLNILVRNWGRSILFFPTRQIDDSYWTLNIEWKFYCVIFLLLFLKRFRVLPQVMGAIGALSSLFWTVGCSSKGFLNFPFGNYMGAHLLMWGRNIPLLAHGCYFAVGVFLWLCLLRKTTPTRLSVLAICTVGSVLGIACRTQTISQDSGNSFTPAFPIIVWLSSVGLTALSVIANDAISCAAGPAGTRLLRRLGLMTYPLYLLHQRIGIIVLRHMWGRAAGPLALFTGVALVLVLAAGVSLYLEPPLQRLLKCILAFFTPAERDPAYPRHTASQPKNSSGPSLTRV